MKQNVQTKPTLILALSQFSLGTKGLEIKHDLGSYTHLVTWYFPVKLIVVMITDNIDV